LGGLLGLLPLLYSPPLGKGHVIALHVTLAPATPLAKVVRPAFVVLLPTLAGLVPGQFKVAGHGYTPFGYSVLSTAKRSVPNTYPNGKKKGE
jgi:hypothetical protein